MKNQITQQQTAKADNNNFKIYSLLHESEQHFDSLQSDYRKMASTWLLAVFAGVGFAFTKITTAGLADYRFLICALICLAGAIGILLLWNLDLLVYHRLLAVFSKAAKKMEKRDDSLPNVHKKIEKTIAGSVRSKVLFFYRIPAVLLVGLSGVGMYLFFGQDSSSVWISSAIHLLLIFLLWWGMGVETSKNAPLKKTKNSF